MPSAAPRRPERMVCVSWHRRGQCTTYTVKGQYCAFDHPPLPVQLETAAAAIPEDGSTQPVNSTCTFHEMAVELRLAAALRVFRRHCSKTPLTLAHYEWSRRVCRKSWKQFTIQRSLCCELSSSESRAVMWCHRCLLIDCLPRWRSASSYSRRERCAAATAIGQWRVDQMATAIGLMQLAAELHRKSSWPQAKIHAHTDWVRAIAVHADGRQVVTTSDDNTIKVWSFSEGCTAHKTIWTFEGHSREVICVSLLGHKVLSGSADSTAIVWSLTSGAALVVSRHHPTKSVLCVALGTTHAYSGGSDCRCVQWDCETGDAVCVFEHHRHVTALVLDERNNQILTGAHDEMIRSWEIGTGVLLRYVVALRHGVVCY